MKEVNVFAVSLDYWEGVYIGHKSFEEFKRDVVESIKEAIRKFYDNTGIVLCVDVPFWEEFEEAMVARGWHPVKYNGVVHFRAEFGGEDCRSVIVEDDDGWKVKLSIEDILSGGGD